LPREPLISALLAATLVAAVTASFRYRRGTRWRFVSLLALCLSGATAAKLRVDSLDGPHIERGISAAITGRVVDRESRFDRRPRITLDRLSSDIVPAGQMPNRIRLTVSPRTGLPELGARISLRARLMPVAEPAVPGGYDPRRAAYFQGIGGSGFALGTWEVLEPPRPSLDLSVARIRAAIVARIIAAQPGEAGAVAAALLVGERAGLSEATNESLRLSGLAHILSISGLHMMLIAGTAFFSVRAALALSPGLALARPIRKWAALAALLVVSFYLALSGGGVATVRAYVMAVIMFTAILVDRPAISIRNLALAAFAVLAMEPESITEPGFQMSFGAVAALIAGWEAWHERRRRRLSEEAAFPGLGLARLLGNAIIGVCLTSFVAGLATAPFAAYHFERVATYSLLGNLLSAPLVSFIIMPFGLLTLAALPLGLEAPPLAIMAWGINLLLGISDWVASLPGADLPAPHIPPASLLLVSTGLLWLCLWRLRWRLLAVPMIGAGLLLIPVLAAPADVLIAPDGKVVAVRDPAGVLRVSGSRAGSYLVEQFFDEEPGPLPEAATLREGVRCDPLGCVLRGARDTEVAHVLDPAAFTEECRRADLLVTPLNAPTDCPVTLLIDKPRLAQFGAHAVRIENAGTELRFAVTTERSAFPRPWQARGKPPVNISAGAP
jgi:competence protein ComEC